MAAPLHRRGEPRRRRRIVPALFVAALVIAILTLVPRLFGEPLPAAGAGAGHAEGQLPACRYADVSATRVTLDDWRSTLLDTTYALPQTYAPDDLVDADGAGLNPGFPVRALVLPDLRALVAAAHGAGVALGVVSAYRSYEYQVRTFARWEADVGHDQALETSARPGHSEHQLGTALDFSNAKLWAPWDDDDWISTAGGAWLAHNAWRFGFVMSYPAGARSVTCYDYEPWHYRYVGRQLAAQVHADGRSLRELLWELQP
jgi:D-alanyl-D-alanine carboxypeptidase